MLVNPDRSRAAVVGVGGYRWVASPQAGVERAMLERFGGEDARATSIVRYAPGSAYPAHRHPGGEEILVLSGIFSEGKRHYPAGWYLRNPPGSAHRPSSAGGTTIFVRLGYMTPDELHEVRIDTRQPAAWQQQLGREVCPLFAGALERASLQRLAPHAALLDAPAGVAEMLVIAGSLSVGREVYPQGSWLRLPRAADSGVAAGERGATVYLNTRVAA
jgi:quercetin dioxygenase-like cupin family protein